MAMVLCFPLAVVLAMHRLPCPQTAGFQGGTGIRQIHREITQCLGENQSEWVRSAACRGSLVLLVLSVLHVDTTPQRDPSLLALTLLIPSEKKRSFSLKEQFKRGGKQSLLILADDDTAH